MFHQNVCRTRINSKSNLDSCPAVTRMTPRGSRQMSCAIFLAIGFALCLAQSARVATAAVDDKPAAKQLVDPAKKAAANPKANANVLPDANELHEPVGKVKPNPKRPKGRLPLISKITREIAKEGQAGWTKEHEWPHRYADYSTRKDVALTNRQIIQALMKRQDNHPALDAYVRWQLLSFAPDLSAAKPIELKRLAALMPQLVRLPAPPRPGNIYKSQGGSNGSIFIGKQQAFLSDLRPVPGSRVAKPRLGVINSGSGLGVEVTDPEKVLDDSRDKAYDLVKSRDTIERLNTPAIHYRDAFVRLLPRKEGVRLEAMFIDLKERLEAADPGWKAAAQAFYDEAFHTRSDKDIPSKLRKKLEGQMKVLGSRGYYVVRDIKIDNAGNMAVAKDIAKFPPKHLHALLGYLHGPVFEDEK